MDPLLVNQTRWSDLLKQLAVLKGLDHVELSPLIIAAIIAENDRPEFGYLAGEHLAFGQYLLAAIAAITGYVGVRNPSGSGKLVVVTRIQSVGTGWLRYYIGLVRGATLTAQSTEQPRDTRIQPSGAFGTFAPNIVGQIVSGRSDTIAVTPFVVAELIQANNAQNGVWTEPIVLAPGDTVLVFPSDAAGGTTVNVQVQGSFSWRERTLEPTET